MTEKSIILFDGVCNLCNSSIDFIIQRDKNDKFLVGPLQEKLGGELTKKFDIPEDYLDSLVLIENDQIFFKSTAALKIARNLSGGWPAFYPLIYLPKVLRDPVYDWIARNRYKWFGKKNTCRLPTPEESAKFLSAENTPA
ncbi:thiol-disulfide oxidoreductase DCC family protein [Algoriphagus sediminis]|uniref:Thiol-disulfide oxidoreductase DCC family protein n=1 Tax=Algoriphagus sediminis TaxID=3057113 RepID=A0ABT7Y973_9BACT|nr:thiol-disulfide oxidoreductase DCC family protein [Algoriphagus sediminis]MDN3203050.1 thiol-disulfide oxidoreductase DCC family protein [Algoriphagus sediminis]